MVNFFENFREIFLHRLSGALELRKCVRPDGAAPFSAPTERGARTAAGVFALTGRLLFCTDCAGCSNCVSVFAPDGRLLSLHRLCEVLELRQRVRPDGAAPFLLRLSGAHELRQRVRPDGRLLSLHRLSGGRELPLAGSPLTGGEFSAEPQRGGIRRLRTAGTLRRPPRGQKGRDTYGFPSSLNSYLSLISYPGENRRAATASK